MRVVDQKRNDLIHFVAEHGALFAAQGSVQESYRLYQGRKLGPFFRLSFREAGKQRSLYIGRDRALAAEINGQLQKLQEPLARARQVDRWLAQCRRSLKLAKLEFRRRLQTHGLRLQGNEIRGWRAQRKLATSPTIRLARRSTAIGQEPSVSAPPPVPQQPFCLDRRVHLRPRFTDGNAARVARRSCSTALKNLCGSSRKSGRRNTALRNRPPPARGSHDHAVY